MDIKIENLTKVYGFQRAVDNISFEVKTGEILGFLGPNGAGKTTTMKMITNYIGIDSGDVKLSGNSIKTNGYNIRKHIGYLPEHNPLYQDMPVMDYLEFSAALQDVPKSLIAARVREMVKLCGLNAEKHKKIGELSKGYRQRVGLAQAMIHDPKILILDEPTSGLDPNQIVEIRRLIKEIGKEKTVILSTHILPEVEATCDRILIINKGKIVIDSTAETLRKQVQGQELLTVTVEDADKESVLKTFGKLPSVSNIDCIGELRYELQGKDNMPIKRDVFTCCVKHKWVITEMTALETKLEDIFRDLTTS